MGEKVELSSLGARSFHVELKSRSSLGANDLDDMPPLPRDADPQELKNKRKSKRPNYTTASTIGTISTNYVEPMVDVTKSFQRWRSWQPGDEPVAYLMPLRPPRETSEPHPDDNSRAFGGIEDRAMRLKGPSVGDVQELLGFYRTLQQEKRRKHRVVAFVNSRSGGNVGETIMKILSQNVGEDEGNPFFGKVCDLSAVGEPEGTINQLAADVNTSRRSKDGHLIDTRILVCGGDGTVTWILTAFEQCQGLQGKLELFPMAIVPLGTGNDLARSLGWGGRLSAVSDIVKKYLRWLGQADIVTLDQWRIILRPHEKLPEDHKLRTPGSHPQKVKDGALRKQLLRDIGEVIPHDDDDGEVYLGYWQNYFSIGIDARITRGVALARSSDWGGCLFRMGLGKAMYPIQGATKMWCNQKLDDSLSSMKVTLPSVEGGPQDTSPSLRAKVASAEARQLMFVNINSYGAGMKVLPEPPVVERLPEPGDGIIEVMTVNNIPSLMAAGFLKWGRLNHLVSSKAAAFSLKQGIDMQLDGEPWNLPVGCDVYLEPHRKVSMLRAPLSSNNWGGHITQDFWHLATTEASRASKRWSGTEGMDAEGLLEAA